MAKTLLDGVNEVLKRVNIVKSTDLLLSLTNAGKQNSIDLTVQCWNEAIDQLYSTAEVPKPFQMETSSITLIADQRGYDLATDVNILYWPLHDEQGGHYLSEYPGGYTKMIRQQPQPDNYTGSAGNAAINPKDGKIYLDRIPTSGEAGRQYFYDYGKETVMTLAADTVPFDDVVFRALVPVVAELYRLYKENKYVDGVSKLNYGRACRYLTKVPQRTSWYKRYVRVGGDPLNAD